MSEREEEVTQGPNNHRTAPPVPTSEAQRSWQRSWQWPVDYQASEELSLSLRYDSSDSASCSLALAQNTATPASLPRYKIGTCSFPLAQDTSTPTSLPLAGDTGVTGSSFVTPEWNADDDATANDVDTIQGVDRGVHPDEHCFADFDCSEESVMRQGKEVTAPVVLSIRGNPVKETKYFERHAFCICMGVKAYKNKSKKEILELIAQNVINNNIYDPIIKTKKTERSAPVLKQIQCPFRLTNVLFPGMFAARFVALSDTRSRADLDTQVSAEDQFWLDVRSSFVDNAPCLEFDNLIVTHPALDAELIKPSLIVQHTVKQLCQIWGTAHGAYRKHTYASLRREQMMKKHNLIGAVNRALPEDAFSESTGSSHREENSTPNGKRKRDVADAIQSFGNQPWREDVAARKLDSEERKLQYLENEEANRVQYLELRSQRQEKRAALTDYTFVSDRLRELYGLQAHETNATIRTDLAEEITILKAKKHKLAEALV